MDEENKYYLDILTEAESNPDIYLRDYKIAGFIQNQIENAPKNLLAVDLDNLKIEYTLFRLQTQNRYSKHGQRQGRFIPVIEFLDGSIFPEPLALQKQLTYIENRTQLTQNPVFKARYYDYLFEYSKSKSNHLYAKNAIDAYLETVDIYTDEDSAIELIDSVQRAAELASILEYGHENRLLMNRVHQEILRLLFKWESVSRYRWTLELFAVLRDLMEEIDDDKYSRILRLIEVSIEYYTGQNNFLLLQSFIDEKFLLQKKYRVSEFDSNELERAKANLFINEAQNKEHDPLVAVHFYSEAIKHIDKLKDESLKNDVIRKIKQLSSTAVSGGHYQEITAEAKIGESNMQALLEVIGKGYDVPQRIGIIPTFIPKINRAQEFSREMIEKYPISHLFSTTHFGKNYPIHSPHNQDQKNEDIVTEYFGNYVKINTTVLTELLLKLIDEKSLYYKHFKRYLVNSRLFDERSLSSVLHGLDRYFEKDYYSSTYILTLQLESFLRRILELLGGQATTTSDFGFEEKGLSRVLKDLKSLGLSEDLYYYCKWVLIDVRGYNLRDDIAHGLFTLDKASPVYPTTILHLFCILCAIITIKNESES